MSRELLSSIYDSIDNNDLADAKNLAKQTLKEFNMGSINRMSSRAPGKNKDLVITLWDEQVSLRKWINSRSKITPKFEEDTEFDCTLPATAMPPYTIHYNPEVQNGFWLQMFHAISYATSNKDIKAVQAEGHKTLYTNFLIEKNARTKAITELRALREWKGINLYGEFLRGEMTMRDYANLQLINSMNKSQISDILNMEERPFISTPVIR